MYWEKELRRKITCAVSQHCPQQQSWAGSHSPGAAVELQPLHRLLPLGSGDHGVLLSSGKMWSKHEMGSQECLESETVSHKVMLNLWTLGTNFFPQKLIQVHSTIGFPWELITELGNFFTCNLIPVLTGWTVKFSLWEKRVPAQDLPVNSHITQVKDFQSVSVWSTTLN